MYRLFCVVLCIVCVQMCTVLLPPGGNPIAVNKYISYIISFHVSYRIVSYIISHRIISYHIISYHIISYHIISYQSYIINALSTPTLLLRPDGLCHPAVRRPSSFISSLLLLVLYTYWHLRPFAGVADLTSSWLDITERSNFFTSWSAGFYITRTTDINSELNFII